MSSFLEYIELFCEARRVKQALVEYDDEYVKQEYAEILQDLSDVLPELSAQQQDIVNQIAALIEQGDVPDVSK